MKFENSERKVSKNFDEKVNKANFFIANAYPKLVKTIDIPLVMKLYHLKESK